MTLAFGRAVKSAFVSFPFKALSINRPCQANDVKL